MKKYLFMLFALFSLVACEKDDNNGGSGNLSEAAKEVKDVDYSSALGMSKSKMISTYGDPAENYGNFYIYNSENENVDMVMFAVNPDNDKVYTATVILMEDAFTEAAIKEYLSSKYNCYGYDEEEGIYTYGNNKDEEKATIGVVQSGANSITWADRNLTPSFEDDVDGAFSDLTPAEAVSMFLGLSEEDLIEEYGESLIKVGEDLYMADVNNDYLMAVGITVTDGKVTPVVLLFNEDLEDEDIVAYYAGLGFTATPCGPDEEGYEVYLFMNMATGEMFTYSGGRAVFMDLSAIDDWEDDDYEDLE